MIGWAALGLAAAGVGATEIRAALRERAALRDHPPEGRFVQVGGARVHYVQEGAGPDVVLIHGASGNTRDMTFGLVPRLREHYRVTAFDRPGLGFTDRARPGLDRVFGGTGETPQEQAALLQGAARAIGIERPIVLGHSLGGAVALAWALLDPQGTAAVVDVSGVAMPWPGSLDLIYRINGSFFGGAWLPPLITAWVPEGAIGAGLRGIFEPDPVPPGFREWFSVPIALRRHSIRANARQVMGLRAQIVEMSRRYDSLPMPVEILHGEADIIVPPTIHAYPLARLAPKANLVMLPGIGHMPHHAAPEAVVAAVDRARARAGL